MSIGALITIELNEHFFLLFPYDVFIVFGRGERKRTRLGEMGMIPYEWYRSVSMFGTYMHPDGPIRMPYKKM